MSAYIGIDGKARKVKSIYIGAAGKQTSTVTLSSSNINTLFNVNNDTHYFSFSGGSFTSESTTTSKITCTTTLTPKSGVTIEKISLSYSGYGSSTSDKFTIKLNNSGTVVSKTFGSYSGSYTSTDNYNPITSIQFKYVKYSTRSTNKATISDISITYSAIEQDKARRVNFGYVGIDNKARLFFSNAAYKEQDNGYSVQSGLTDQIGSNSDTYSFNSINGTFSMGSSLSRYFSGMAMNVKYPYSITEDGKTLTYYIKLSETIVTPYTYKYWSCSSTSETIQHTTALQGVYSRIVCSDTGVKADSSYYYDEVLAEDCSVGETYYDIRPSGNYAYRYEFISGNQWYYSKISLVSISTMTFSSEQELYIYNKNGYILYKELSSEFTVGYGNKTAVPIE